MNVIQQVYFRATMSMVQEKFSSHQKWHQNMNEILYAYSLSEFFWVVVKKGKSIPELTDEAMTHITLWNAGWWFML